MTHRDSLSPQTRTQLRRRAYLDAALILVLGLLLFAVSAHFTLYSKVSAWLDRHEDLSLGDLIVAALFVGILSLVFILRRRSELLEQVMLREQAEAAQARLVPELRRALDEVKTLSGLLPICAWCKKIRDDRGYWNRIEDYIQHRTQAEFTHGICPDCAAQVHGKPLPDPG